MENTSRRRIKNEMLNMIIINKRIFLYYWKRDDVKYRIISGKVSAYEFGAEHLARVGWVRNDPLCRGSSPNCVPHILWRLRGPETSLLTLRSPPPTSNHQLLPLFTAMNPCMPVIGYKYNHILSCLNMNIVFSFIFFHWG